MRRRWGAAVAAQARFELAAALEQKMIAWAQANARPVQFHAAAELLSEGQAQMWPWVWVPGWAQKSEWV